MRSGATVYKYTVEECAEMIVNCRAFHITHTDEEIRFYEQYIKCFPETLPIDVGTVVEDIYNNDKPPFLHGKSDEYDELYYNIKDVLKWAYHKYGVLCTVCKKHYCEDFKINKSMTDNRWLHPKIHDILREERLGDKDITINLYPTWFQIICDSCHLSLKDFLYNENKGFLRKTGKPLWDEEELEKAFTAWLSKKVQYFTRVENLKGVNRWAAPSPR